MKKSLILGAAAMAALSFAPQADAADVKFSGYYQLRFSDADTTLTDTAGTDETQAWFHRLQLNMDAKISEKTSVHLQTRPVNGSAGVDGANLGTVADSTGFQVKQLWMETEMYGVGVKGGNMPLNINDKLLFKDDGGSYGTLLISKSFGDMTVVGLNVRVDEGAISGGTADSDDADIYGLSLLGKAANINYQLTWAHMDLDQNFTTTTAINGVAAGSTPGDSDDDWFALTVGTEMEGVKLTGSLIWETGFDVNNGGDNQLTDGGMLLALRANGKTGFGGWSGYAFHAGEDFTHPQESFGRAAVAGTARNAEDFSPTWRQGGAGGTSLLETWVRSTGNAGNLQNVWGLGAGVSVNAGAWTLKPYVDYAAIVEDNIAGVQSVSDSAWGGTLIATTTLDEGTSFSLIGKYVSPSDDDLGVVDVQDMHALQAEFKVKF